MNETEIHALSDNVVIHAMNKVNAAFQSKYSDHISDIHAEQSEAIGTLSWKLGTAEITWEVRKAVNTSIVRCHIPVKNMDMEDIMELAVDIGGYLPKGTQIETNTDRIVYRSVLLPGENIPDHQKSKLLFEHVLGIVHSLMLDHRMRKLLMLEKVEENSEEENDDPYGFEKIRVAGHQLFEGGEEDPPEEVSQEPEMSDSKDQKDVIDTDAFLTDLIAEIAHTTGLEKMPQQSSPEKGEDSAKEEIMEGKEADEPTEPMPFGDITPEAAHNSTEYADAEGIGDWAPHSGTVVGTEGEAKTDPDENPVADMINSSQEEKEEEKESFMEIQTEEMVAQECSSDDDVLTEQLNAGIEKFKSTIANIEDISYSPQSSEEDEDQELSEFLEALGGQESENQNIAEDVQNIVKDIDAMYDGLKEKLEKVAGIGSSIFIREQEIAVKEAQAKRVSEEADAERAALAKERIEFNIHKREMEDEREKVLAASAEHEARKKEIEAKDVQIAQLTQSLQEERDRLQAFLEGSSSGSAIHQYIKELRRKTGTQQNKIAQLETNLTQAMDFVEKLQERITVYQAEKEKMVYKSVLEKKESEWAADRNLLVSDKAKLAAQVAAASQKEKELKDSVSALVKGKSDLEQQVAQLTRKEVLAREEKDNLSRLLDEAKKNFSESEKTAIEAKDKIEELQQSIDTMEKEKAELNSKIADLKEQLGPDKDNAAEVAAVIKKEFHEIGAELEPVAGASSLTLRGSYKNYALAFNVDARAMFISKPLKKPKKAVSELGRLNELNIRTSYNLDAETGEITGRLGCYDIENATVLFLDAVSELDALE